MFALQKQINKILYKKWSSLEINSQPNLYHSFTTFVNGQTAENCKSEFASKAPGSLN